VLSFEFGLGLSGVADMAGPAIGPMSALEVLTAFFLEAGFLGIMRHLPLASVIIVLQLELGQKLKKAQQ
jgi:Cytochrome bd terminal oxidase subunit I